MAKSSIIPEKFIVFDNAILRNNQLENKRAVLLNDYKYWDANQRELTEWCKQTNSVQEGMLLMFPDERTLTMFCLRWPLL